VLLSDRYKSIVIDWYVIIILRIWCDQNYAIVLTELILCLKL
jgi:hypothetical protein